MNDNHPYSLWVALVICLAAMSLIRQLFPDSWALGFWALVVNSVILVIIVAQIIVSWQRARGRTSDEQAVFGFLAGDPKGTSKTIKEICAATRIKPKRVRAALHRLRDKHGVDCDHQDRWRKVNF